MSFRIIPVHGCLPDSAPQEIAGFVKFHRNNQLQYYYVVEKLVRNHKSFELIALDECWSDRQKADSEAEKIIKSYFANEEVLSVKALQKSFVSYDYSLANNEWSKDRNYDIWEALQVKDSVRNLCLRSSYEVVTKSAKYVVPVKHLMYLGQSSETNRPSTHHYRSQIETEETN